MRTTRLALSYKPREKDAAMPPVASLIVSGARRLELCGARGAVTYTCRGDLGVRLKPCNARQRMMVMAGFAAVRRGDAPPTRLACKPVRLSLRHQRSAISRCASPAI